MTRAWTRLTCKPCTRVHISCTTETARKNYSFQEVTRSYSSSFLSHFSRYAQNICKFISAAAAVFNKKNSYCSDWFFLIETKQTVSFWWCKRKNPIKIKQLVMFRMLLHLFGNREPSSGEMRLKQIFNYNRWFVKKINDNRMIAKKTTAVKKRNTLFQIANTSCLLHATRCNRNNKLSCFLIFNMWKIPTQMKSCLAKLNFVHDWLSKKSICMK